MDIEVNGEPRQVPAGTSVGGLLASLGLSRDGVAVAVDQDVVPRSAHPSRVLRAGERVEIIIAVGGG
ncbi:MAG: sulfur carrier protein ThiS [Deltaproteobacteria bacterium]|nr:MAG: sulfur carrier protein ThiS [Deltaproteobacteria bacterium]